MKRRFQISCVHSPASLLSLCIYEYQQGDIKLKLNVKTETKCVDRRSQASLNISTSRQLVATYAIRGTDIPAGIAPQYFSSVFLSLLLCVSTITMER